MFENLDGVCFRCGCFHLPEEKCSACGGKEGDKANSRPKNMARDYGEDQGAEVRGSWLRLWLVAI